MTVDRNGGRNQETLFRLQRTDTRDCSACHDRSSLQANLRRRPMYEGVDLTGLTNIQSSAHDVGLLQAAARHDAR